MTLTPSQRAIWATLTQLECLIEAGDDVDAAIDAAEMIVATQPEPKDWESVLAEYSIALSTSANAYFAHDIHDERAQRVLDKCLEAAKVLSTEARKELGKALEAGPRDSGTAILAFINKYQLQLVRLLTATQLAALLEGALEVAGKLHPRGDMQSVIDGLPISEQEKIASASTKTDHPRDDKGQFIPQTEKAPTEPPDKPPTSDPFTPEAPDEDDPESIIFPMIEESVRILSEKNLMNADQYRMLESAARAKAFTVAGVDSEDTLAKIRDVLAKNIEEGADYAAFKQEVLDSVGEGTFLSEAHQEMVFRTNVQSAFSDGQMSVLNDPLIRSGFPYSIYSAIHDNRVRPNHLALEELGINGTNVYRNDDPVFQLFRPPWNFNCVLPGNYVSGRIVGALRSFYSGEVAEILTANGARTTLTINHSVLTKDGFIRVGSLKKGDNLLCYVRKGKGSGSFRNIQYAPTLIEEIFNSFESVYHSKTLETLDLNGDEKFMMSQVDMVLPYLTRCKLMTSKPKSKPQVSFVSSNNSGMRRCNLSNPLLLTHPRPLESFGLALTSDMNISRLQHSTNNTARYSKSLRNSILRFTRSISGNDSIFVHDNPMPHLCCIGHASELDTVFSQPSSDGITFNPNLAPELLERFAGKVTCSKVIDIRHFQYSGPVYDLETDPGYFTTNQGGLTSIIIRNCRCSWIPITVRQAAEMGVGEAQNWLETGIEPIPPAHVAMPPFAPPPGFARGMASMPLSVRLSAQSLHLPIALSTDQQGHEHKAKGPAGGQFVPKGRAGSDVIEGQAEPWWKSHLEPEQQRQSKSPDESEPTQPSQQTQPVQPGQPQQIPPVPPVQLVQSLSNQELRQKYGGTGRPKDGAMPTMVNQGWKIHLNVAPENRVIVEEWLRKQGMYDHTQQEAWAGADKGIPLFKSGRNSGQEGKDFTVYIGERDSANTLAELINSQLGDKILPASGDALTDDMPLSGNIVGRFDIAGFDREFHQYGSQGVPYFQDDMAELTFGGGNKNAMRMKANTELMKRYGTYYAGSQQPKQSTLPDWMK